MLHPIPLHSIPLNFTQLHSIPPHSTLLYFTPLHSALLHTTPLKSIPNLQSWSNLKKNLDASLEIKFQQSLERKSQLWNSGFVSGSYLDVFARKALWENGLGYNHGTGHGIGMFLRIHEGG